MCSQCVRSQIFTYSILCWKSFFFTFFLASSYLSTLPGAVINQSWFFFFLFFFRLEPFQLWKWYCCCGRSRSESFSFFQFRKLYLQDCMKWSTVRVFFSLSFFFIYWCIRAKEIIGIINDFLENLLLLTCCHIHSIYYSLMEMDGWKHHVCIVYGLHN